MRNTSSIIKGALLLVVMAMGSATFTAEANAQQGEAVERITLSPSSRTLKANAGDVIDGTMKVANTGTIAFDFTLYARPYSVSSEQYDPNFTDPTPNADVYKWVQFEQTKYHVEPGETIEAGYTLRVPANAAPGGHYGVLFAETEGRGTNTTGIDRQKRVGKVIYATVNGEHETKGLLREFILPFWQTKAPVVSSARIVNAGNVDFRAKVATTATDVFGRTKFRYIGDPIVLPDTTRLVEMKWENAPSFGIFKVRQTAAFLNQKHSNEGYVLIAPVWFPIIIVLLIAFGGVYVLRQWRKNRR